MMIRSCLAILAAVPLFAQGAPPGYADTVSALPPGSGSVLALPGDDLVWFTGSDLVVSRHGQQRVLPHVPTPVFGSFTAVADDLHLLFAESTWHAVWLVPRQGGAPRMLANVPFAYDAAVFAAGRVLVSAKTGGFATPDNEVLLLDLATGATQVVLRVPGASGPIAIDGHGDLWYATSALAFPTPPGTTDVLRWTRASIDAAVAQGIVLGTAQAQVMFAGLDSAGDLAFDGDGDLLFVDWYRGSVGELDDVLGPTPRRTDLLAYGTGGVAPGTVQFVAGAPGPFEPFAPDTGHRLFVHESTFGTVSQVRVVRNARPRTSVAPTPIPAGPFAITTVHGPAGALGLVAVTAVLVPGETVFAVPGFEQPLSWNTGMLAAVNTHVVAFDALGTAALALVNPGFPAGLIGRAQCAFLAPAAGVIGSAAPVDLALGN